MKAGRAAAVRMMMASRRYQVSYDSLKKLGIETTAKLAGAKKELREVGLSESAIAIIVRCDSIYC